jgi:hypothetical protein
MTDWPVPLRLHFHLLDRQIVDPAGLLVGKVDDLLLEDTDDGGMRVAALVLGQGPLGQRLGGPIGRWMAGTAQRLHPREDYRPLHIPIEFVVRIDSAVHIGLHGETMPTPPLEDWLLAHLIDRIPGAGDAG